MSLGAPSLPLCAGYLCEKKICLSIHSPIYPPTHLPTHLSLYLLIWVSGWCWLLGAWVAGMCGCYSLETIFTQVQGPLLEPFRQASRLSEDWMASHSPSSQVTPFQSHIPERGWLTRVPMQARLWTLTFFLLHLGGHWKHRVSSQPFLWGQ